MGDLEVSMAGRIPRAMGVFAVVAALAAAPTLHAQATRDGTIAKLVDMNGNVLVSRESGLATGNEGLRVTRDSRVITTANSQVVVLFDDGCRVRVEENQRFETRDDRPCGARLAEAIMPSQAAVPLIALVVPGLFGGAGIAGLSSVRNEPAVSPN
jgi:hypothetical protein